MKAKKLLIMAFLSFVLCSPVFLSDIWLTPLWGVWKWISLLPIYASVFALGMAMTRNTKGGRRQLRLSGA